MVRKKPLRAQAHPPPYDPFIARIIGMPGQPAQCRIQLAEYPSFRQALRARLQARGLHEEHIAAVLHGRLTGVCPICQERLSLEYLEGLCGAGDPAGIPSPRALARFADGRCINAGCPSREILLLWRS